MESNLSDEKDSDEVVAEVIMLRGASSKTMMLVEGGDDEKIFIKFVDEDNCEIVICGGRDIAIPALVKLEKRSIQGVLCIVDADFSAFLGRMPSDSVSLFSTDDHDLEIMLFKSRAFDHVVKELGSPEKVKRVSKQLGDLREPIWRAAHCIGLLRFYSLTYGLNLKFKEIPFNFVDRRSLSVDIDLMIKAVFDHSRKVVVDRHIIKNFIEEWLAKDHDHWQMCCGHDIAAILGRAFLSFFGSQRSAVTDGPKIEQQLRLAYSIDQFQNTKLYKKNP